MDTEFHYWLTGLIAKRAGFTDDEAQTIAYASEYVDRNDVGHTIRFRDSDREPYQHFISQTMNILKAQTKLMRIYPIFHFVPGDPLAKSAQRRDGKMHLLNTTPNSGHANEMIDEAFKAGDDTALYRIGIASHMYVDTWAHQNFVGGFDAFNQLDGDIKPNIGHADAEHHPDWVSHQWTDNRLVEPDIDNRARFLSAAKALFEKYGHYQDVKTKSGNTTEWSTLERDLIQIMGPTYSGNDCRNKEERIKRYQDILPEFTDFDERDWFDAAIETNVRGIEDSDEGITSALTIFRDQYFWKVDDAHLDTHWFRFQEAVKDHERFGIELLSPIFKQMDIQLADI